MEPRKVQKVGYSTLSVSLPMDWTKKMNLQKGDILFLSEENDGTLRVNPKPTMAEDNKTYIVNVDQCDNAEVLARVIVGSYVLGRNLIRVEAERRLMREQIEGIRKVTQNLLGIGIIEESERHLLLQCSIDPKKFPIATVLKRLYVITSIMFKDAMDAIMDRDMELARDATTREHEADTIFWLLVRLLSSAQQSKAVAEAIGIVDPMDIVEQNTIAWFLEMIGDRLNSIAENVILMDELREEGNDPLVERLAQIGQLCFTMFDKAMRSFLEKDIQIASDAVDLFDTLELEEENLLIKFQEKTNAKLASLVNEIAWELKMVAEHSSAIAEISIDYVLRGNNHICSVYSTDEIELP